MFCLCARAASELFDTYPEPPQTLLAAKRPHCSQITLPIVHNRALLLGPGRPLSLSSWTCDLGETSLLIAGERTVRLLTPPPPTGRGWAIIYLVGAGALQLAKLLDHDYHSSALVTLQAR